MNLLESVSLSLQNMFDYFNLYSMECLFWKDMNQASEKSTH